MKNIAIFVLLFCSTAGFSQQSTGGVVEIQPRPAVGFMAMTDLQQPLVECSLSPDGKYKDCKIAEGHTVTEVVQFFVDLETRQSKEWRTQYDLLFDNRQKIAQACRVGLNACKEGLKAWQKENEDIKNVACAMGGKPCPTTNSK